MIKTPFVFAAVTIAIMGSWFAYSDNSPFNACEPTDEVRILLGGREYHIPVEWQPTISKKREGSFPVKFSYKDHTGKYIGRGMYVYCQGDDEKLEQYDSISFDPQTILRISPNFWRKHRMFEFLPKLAYINIEELGIDAPALDEPHLRRSGPLYAGMYWRYENPPNRESKSNLFYLYSHDWQHEGAPVKGACFEIAVGTTVTCRVWAKLNSNERVSLHVSSYHQVAPKEAHLYGKTPPQEWPAMLEEITELMRSFEVIADQGE